MKKVKNMELNKKMIVGLLISNYWLSSDLLEKNYDKWLALKNITIGDTVFEKTAFFRIIRSYNEGNYELAYSYMNDSFGILLEITETATDTEYKLQKNDGTIISWRNCEFMKLKLE